MKDVPDKERKKELIGDEGGADGEAGGEGEDHGGAGNGGRLGRM